jgi:hypothetical protein
MSLFVFMFLVVDSAQAAHRVVSKRRRRRRSREGHNLSLSGQFIHRIVLFHAVQTRAALFLFNQNKERKKKKNKTEPMICSSHLYLVRRRCCRRPGGGSQLSVTVLRHRQCFKELCGAISSLHKEERNMITRVLLLLIIVPLSLSKLYLFSRSIIMKDSISRTVFFSFLSKQWVLLHIQRR